MTMHRLRAPGGLSLALLLVLSAATAQAQQFIATGRDTLRGLPGVEVIVEGIEPVFERGGLNAAAIQADVVARLAEAGIPIYASQKLNPSVAKAYVYVDITGLKVGRDGYAIGVQLHLRQTVRSSVTNSNVVNAMTWDQHTVVFVPPSRLKEVRTVVQSQVEQFVEDWQAVH
jgi:hypothetical protein